MIWFTSDTHFGHVNILTFGRAAGVSLGAQTAVPTIEDHDALLVKNWNAVVGANDPVYHLGDFALCGKSRSAEVWHELRGAKHHVPGNHDPESFLDMVRTFSHRGHKVLERLHSFRADKLKTELCHYPLEVWDRCHHGSFHLHGHSHDNCNTRPNARRLDVGMDTAARLLGVYRPFSWDEIKAIMAERDELGGRDHHGQRDAP